LNLINLTLLRALLQMAVATTALAYVTSSRQERAGSLGNFKKAFDLNQLLETSPDLFHRDNENKYIVKSN